MPAQAPARKAIVIGASSGIGRALAKALAAEGYTVGLAARRTELLESLQKEIASPTLLKPMDLRDIEGSRRLFNDLVRELGGVDLVVLNSGVNPENPDKAWDPEHEILQVNVVGFAALASEAADHFERQGSGHLVGISSIAGLRGSPKCPAYSASKSFASRLLEGLRMRLSSQGIAVTDIRPGFVDTAMIAGSRVRFWVASCETAAAQIVAAIRARKKKVYVTRRWALVAFALHLVPEAFLAWGNKKFRMQPVEAKKIAAV
ncbi:MAG TPA: SDR family NAD(P)-dependent oxidoreductase [Verrucomicrobiae bacterium]|jgi:short-subunit dehydrogenase|nr:SDR family NAD(P)-dependent oxidoreductase [Verrucomicrobiae bacterium]